MMRSARARSASSSSAEACCLSSPSRRPCNRIATSSAKAWRLATVVSAVASNEVGRHAAETNDEPLLLEPLVRLGIDTHTPWVGKNTPWVTCQKRILPNVRLVPSYPPIPSLPPIPQRATTTAADGDKDKDKARHLLRGRPLLHRRLRLPLRGSSMTTRCFIGGE